jgi:SAM-dependent methyltransferase
MNIRQKISTMLIYYVETILYVKHKLLKTSYADYYAERMDIQIKIKPNWGLDLNKRFQVDFLVNNGIINTSTRFLDYGCGALSAGTYFIKYLNKNKYFGVDVSKGVLKEGLKRIENSGLSGKNAQLRQIPSGVIEPIVELGTFDIIWAQSVLTHMPPKDIEFLLSKLPILLKDTDSSFYATFAITDGDPVQKKYKDWYYSIGYLSAIAKNSGLIFDVNTDWSHPEDIEKIDTLGRFRLNK